MSAKKFYGIIFLVSLLIGQSQPVLPLIEYYLFQESIIELLCENKERTDIDCDGMCYLKKQIEQQQETQGSQPFSLINADDVIPLYLSMYSTGKNPHSPSFSHVHPVSSHYLFRSAADIFHPPRG